MNVRDIEMMDKVRNTKTGVSKALLISHHAAVVQVVAAAYAKIRAPIRVHGRCDAVRAATAATFWRQLFAVDCCLHVSSQCAKD